MDEMMQGQGMAQAAVQENEMSAEQESQARQMEDIKKVIMLLQRGMTPEQLVAEGVPEELVSMAVKMMQQGQTAMQGQEQGIMEPQEQGLAAEYASQYAQ